MIDSKSNFEKFYNSALKFLSYRPRSEKEVRDYLKVKSQKSTHSTSSGLMLSEVEASKVKITIQNSKVIDEVIQKLIEKKFINDEEFAKTWIESRLRFRPRSLRLIKIELRQKGISQELIDKMTNDEGLMINDSENAQKLIQKRIGRLKSLSKEEVYQKLGRYLASKGFSWDTIKKSIDPDLIGVDESLDKGV